MDPRSSSPPDRATRDPLHALREQLEAEYGDTVPHAAIDEAATEALGELHDARIREFVPVFAWRRARMRLRGAS